MTGFLLNRQFWLFFIAFLLTIATLYKPKISWPQHFFRQIHVFDITQSMNVEDVPFKGGRIRRLEAAKRASRAALERMPCGSELGFAIFTEHRSFLLLTPVDVCANYTELLKVLDNIDWHIAWRSRSEVAKGLHVANRIATALEKPARIVSFTDGHESPPVHPQLRFVPDPAPSGQHGIIVGVGGSEPAPIPRYDLSGKKLGYWRAEDVSQVDVYSRGRPVAGSESMIGAAAMLGTGQEHLSFLHADYLRQLATESAMTYLPFSSVKRTAKRIMQTRWAERRVEKVDVRWLLALFALLLLLLAHSQGFFIRWIERFRLRQA